MNGKIMIIVYVPLIEKEFEIYIPTVKKVGAIKKIIIKIVTEESDGLFEDDGYKNLYDKATGEKIGDDIFVKNSSIKNGTKLVLY